MNVPDTEREALDQVMRQAESDLASAHAEICRLAGLDPATTTWPEWSPQANSLRWFKEIRKKFGLHELEPVTPLKGGCRADIEMGQGIGRM